MDVSSSNRYSERRSEEIYSEDKRMKEVIELAKNIAVSKASVLIEGASGTGKEVLARYIHKNSNRKNKPFIAVNCSALPENLIESELFGYEKGAFTGAVSDKPGLFELANGGTFLLDEISELPMLLQAKLLRVIQEGELTRLGGRKSIKLNVRLIATSNKCLKEMISLGSFRDDLYYRINVIKIKIPDLQDRKSDIEYLSNFFINVSSYINDLPKKIFTKEAMDKLLNWTWPGNVRELENVIERAVLLGKEEKIQANDIYIEDLMGSKNITKNREFDSEKISDLRLGQSLESVEKQIIIQTLEYTSNNRTHAADILGISVRTLRNKLNQYKNQYRGEVL